MSGLRWMGVLLAIMIMAGLLFASRKKRNRRDILLGWFLSLCLLGVAIFPQVVSIPASFLSLGKSSNGRILTLLIAVIVAMAFVIVNERNKAGKTSRILNQLVDNLALDDFRRQYGTMSIGPILVVIPAFNEADNIAKVLSGIPTTVHGMRVSRLVVVDGSRDSTADIARLNGALVCFARANRGGGAALRLGYAIGSLYGAEYIVTLDADGQHVPKEMERLLEPLILNQADFVQGSRRLGSFEKSDFSRWLGIYFFSSLIRLITGVKITDSSNGFRAMRAEMLSKIPLQEDQYYSSELLIAAIKRGYRVTEAAVTVKSRHSGTTKKGSNLSYGLQYAKVVMKTWLREI